VTDQLNVTRAPTTCKNCGDTFISKRADAQWCSPACRTAGYRKRREPPARVWWSGKESGLGKVPKSKNADGSPALSNYELGRKLLEIADEEDGGEAKTGRRYYYLALSLGWIQPAMGPSEKDKDSRDAAYDRVTHVLGVLRKSGDLPWSMVLDLTRELDQWQVYESPRAARKDMRDSYQEDRWLGQPYYPIFLVEKDTMEPVCRPMASRWQMPFASSRGYSSLKLQHDVAEVLKNRFKRHGQRAIVYFISDHDPSGLDLQRAWEQALRDFGAPVAGFVRIGLTLHQVAKTERERGRSLSIQVKPSDSRSKGYVEKYGDRAWEVDILAPSEIEAALNQSIRSWIDAERWNRRNAEIRAARALL
jgi:hypothetical protein